jgi:hypothetical protein
MDTLIQFFGRFGMRRVVVYLTVLSGSLQVCCASQVQQTEWPMLAHDPARSGATTAEVGPPFERKWYRLFPDEGLMAGIQPIVADGKVFVGTMRGTLYAIDSETGKDVWACKTPGSILHACAVARGKVFFTNAEGKVYALNLTDGTPAWSVQIGPAVWNAPLVYQGVVIIGGRDGGLYAIEADSGRIKWKTLTGGPLLCSPALDAKAGRVYAASEDMHVYAFDLAGGRILWRGGKLPGVSFRGYHPVVAPDGSVMITVTPALSLDSFEPILLDMVKEIFGDFASWRHTKEENERLRLENFKLMDKPGTYQAQLDYIRRRLTEEPVYQTFFVLDAQTGKQKFVAPIVYAESMNGTGAPPIVTPDGKVIVKFQALLRSRYQHYSPFLNVGYLDTSTGHITPIMDQSRTYGWHDSLLLVHDEQCQLTAAGRVLINTHQDNVNGMDLDALQGYAEPFCRNIHEPKPGEAVAIWATILQGDPLPVGKEWLARGTAVYGGGSVIDTPVCVAGDSFYYIPTHEINSGVALIAYRMAPDGTAGKESEPPAGKLTDTQSEYVQKTPWDWDMLGMSRLNHVLKALPGRIPGTFEQGEPAAKYLAPQFIAGSKDLQDAELDRIIWEVPSVQMPENSACEDLKQKLSSCIRELISRDWQPWVFPSGKHPREAYRFFTEPAETLYTLAWAYNYLESDLQRQVRDYVLRASSAGGPLAGPTGKRSFDPTAGTVRSLYDIPTEKLFRVIDDITRSDVARLYPIWLWAYTSGDWSHIERHWNQMRDLVDQPPNKMEEDCRNGYVAGLIAYCRLAARMTDDAAVEKGLGVTREALRERLTYELAHTRGGLITQVPVLRSIFGRWRHLTPEVGRLCATYAAQTHEHLTDVYVDYHRPTWYLAWNVELMWRNECPFAFPTMSAEIFAARALIPPPARGRACPCESRGESPDKLERFLDIPWCKADLFYIQKLVFCIESHGSVEWQRAPISRRPTK